jgi:hypothetical protein
MFSFRWKKNPPARCGRTRAANILRQAPGPSRQVSRECGSIAENYFKLFVTNDMMHLIVLHTNEEGRCRKGDSWVDTTLEEITKLVGAFLLAGVYLSKNESITQLWNNENGRPIFQKIMPRNRFCELMSILRFDDKITREERRKNDKLAAFREIWEMFVGKCKAHYIPNEHVTVDEQLVTFRGRCPFKIYLPQKPGRYGIKIWILADAVNHYCINAEVYLGRKGEERERNQGSRVVLELTHHLSDSGRNVVADNFFSSFSLVRCLEARRLTFFGTIRKNKPELPTDFLPNPGRVVGSSIFGFNETTTIVSYVPKQGKAVNLISSLHNDTSICSETGKPQMILDYNRYKGGVDTLDQVVRAYSCKRRTRRWPMCLFYNLIDMAAYNSFVLFTHCNPTWNSSKSHKRRLFLTMLARELVRIPENGVECQAGKNAC